MYMWVNNISILRCIILLVTKILNALPMAHQPLPLALHADHEQLQGRSYKDAVLPDQL